MSIPGSQPPLDPLPREEFRRALASGHGRAKIHAARHGVGEFKDEVLAAATVCGIYDLQSNGAREDWLADLVLAAGVEREVIALPVPEDPSDRDQRAALLKELAQRKIPGAREALYACWGPSDYSDYYAATEIIQLDGDAGLLFVARGLGQRCLEDPEYWLSESEFWAYDEARSEDAALAVLAAHADGDEHIRACLDAIEADRKRTVDRASRPDRPRPAIESVIASIRRAGEPQQVIRIPSWGMKAPREDQERVLELLLTLEAPRPLHHALWFLGMSTMPPLHPRIFELTRHEDDEVRYWAARCLSKHSLHGVRMCGLEALARGDLVVAHEVLTRSAQVDDIEALVAALHPLDDPNKEHAVCSGILDLFKHSPEVRDLRLALYAYERTPCMHCREKAVRFLVHRKEAPEWLLEECTNDAAEGIRELAASARTPRPPTPSVS